MECTKDKIYFLIESCRRNDMDASATYQFINKSWPNDCPSLRHIRRLCQEFREETRQSFERNPGQGRPQSETRKNSVTIIEDMIKEDGSLTINKISDVTGLSHSMVQRIIDEDLDVSWRKTRWVPHTLSENNKAVRVERCQVLIDSMQSRLCMKNLVIVDEKLFYCRNMKPSHTYGTWVFPGGDVTQTPRRSQLEKKFHVIVAVTTIGKHYFEVLSANETINSERYVTFLENLETFLMAQDEPILPENMRLLQDNARPHTAANTIAYIENRNIRLLRQPPYSPDCNVCDRFIFPRLESRRDNQNANFASMEDLQTFLQNELPLFTADRMKAACRKMIKDMQKIIENNGHYV